MGALRDARYDAYATPSRRALVRECPQRAIADLTLGWKTLVSNTIDGNTSKVLSVRPFHVACLCSPFKSIH